MQIYKIGCKQILQVRLFGREELIPPVRHSTRQTAEYVMYIMIKGKLCIRNNDEAVTMLPGDIRIFHKGDFQTPLDVSHCVYFYIHFDSTEISYCTFTEQAIDQYWMDRKIRFLQSNPYETDSYEYSEILLPNSFHISDSMVAFWERELSMLNSHHKEMNYKAALSWALMSLLNKISQEHFDKGTGIGLRLGQSNYNVIQELIRYLNANYAKNITGRDLEQLFYINFSYANRLFKKATGITIFAYKNELKINRAKVLLATTDKSVSQIATEVGYGDVFSFSHAFKKATGFPPGDYRRNYIRNSEL